MASRATPLFASTTLEQEVAAGYSRDDKAVAEHSVTEHSDDLSFRFRSQKPLTTITLIRRREESRNKPISLISQHIQPFRFGIAAQWCVLPQQKIPCWKRK